MEVPPSVWHPNAGLAHHDHSGSCRAAHEPYGIRREKVRLCRKEAAKKAEEQKKHDDAIRAETLAASNKEWSEKVGNNPNIRQAEVSRFSNLEKAVKAGERPD